MYYFLLNPAASSGQGQAVWKEIEPVLRRWGVSYELYTGGPAKLESVVREISGRATRTGNPAHLIVLGGDGTLNLVVNAAADLSTVRISCLWAGSGNDFARNAGVEEDCRRALVHLLREPAEQVLDYGEAFYIAEDGSRKRKRFVISSGVGYDANVCERVGRSELKQFLNRIHLGKLSYLLIGASEVFSGRSVSTKLVIDGGAPVVVRNLVYAVGMIHGRQGGGVPFCPNADPVDGKLDLSVGSGRSRVRRFFEILSVYLGRHRNPSALPAQRCERIRILPERPQWIHLDGETPARVTQAVLTCRRGLHFVK